METLRRFLLGSAAVLLAAGAGQAAELHGKAKTDQTKNCSVYGAGFHYVPSTGLCVKVGGWTRAEALAGGNGDMNWSPFNGRANSRPADGIGSQVSGYVTTDVRKKTEYGTLRAYLSVGANHQ
jgi:hypothetical protein